MWCDVVVFFFWRACVRARVCVSVHIIRAYQVVLLRNYDDILKKTS